MPASSESSSRILARLDLSSGELLGHSNQGEVRRLRVEGMDLAIKQPKGGWPAWQLRRAMLRHEFRAYQRLKGVPGFAHCHGLFDERFLVLDFVDALPFRQARLDEPQAYFDRLLILIRAMHARGVAHGDLKRKDNLLVDRRGQPVLLDLGTATLLKPGWHPLNRRLFRYMCQTDLNAWVKLKYDGYSSVAEADQSLLKHSALERVLRKLRRR